MITTQPTDTKPPRPTTVVDLFRRFCGLSSGRLLHECIEEPKGLSQPVGKRTKRLMHDSRISLW